MLQSATRKVQKTLIDSLSYKTERFMRHKHLPILLWKKKIKEELKDWQEWMSMFSHKWWMRVAWKEWGPERRDDGRVKSLWIYFWGMTFTSKLLFHILKK